MNEVSPGPRDLFAHMKTALNIDDTVMQRLREETHCRGTAMSALVEAGLRHVSANPVARGEGGDVLPPLPSWDSGGHLVDIANRDELYRVME